MDALSGWLACTMHRQALLGSKLLSKHMHSSEMPELSAEGQCGGSAVALHTCEASAHADFGHLDVWLTTKTASLRERDSAFPLRAEGCAHIFPEDGQGMPVARLHSQPHSLPGCC